MALYINYTGTYPAVWSICREKQIGFKFPGCEASCRCDLLLVGVSGTSGLRNAPMLSRNRLSCASIRPSNPTVNNFRMLNDLLVMTAKIYID